MCNGIPRLLRVQQAAIVLLMAIVAPFLIVQTAQAAATCGDVVINEVLFARAMMSGLNFMSSIHWRQGLF